MSFIIAKKKRYKFQVDLVLEELCSVPFVNAILFSKIRLLDGGSFEKVSNKEEVIDHRVKWSAGFEFTCKMSSNSATGVLDPCLCRVSVRREIKGGRSFVKLGYADINLAQFAGCGVISRRYLLQGYDTRHRQDNSILKIKVNITLQSGDPCFKIPGETPVDVTILEPEKKGDGTDSTGGSVGASSVASACSDIGGHSRKERPCILTSDLVLGHEQCSPLRGDADLGHSRNSSYTSQYSRASASGLGSNFHSHSRQSSMDNKESLVRRNQGDETIDGLCSLEHPKAAERRRKQHGDVKDRRVDSTRVDPNELINELIQETNLTEADESTEVSGLKLFVSKDGTAAVGSTDLCSSMIIKGAYKQVVLPNIR